MPPLEAWAAERGWLIPACTVTELAPRRHQHCVCVFVLNEGERIAAQLRKMAPLAQHVDLIVADGGSCDGGASPANLAACGVRALLVKTGPGRLSAQMRMALAYSLQAGYGGTIVIDGNDKDDPAAVPRFVELLEQGYDHVQGSRFIEGGRAVNTPWTRLLAVRLLHAPMLSRAAGCPYTDTTNGFRAYSRRLLTDPAVLPFRDVFSNYELHYYLAIRAARLGFRVTETPVTRSYPKTGKTPTKIHGFRGNWLVWRTLLDACRHRFDPANESPPAKATPSRAA